GRDARFSRQTLCRPATRDGRPAVSETRASLSIVAGRMSRVDDPDSDPDPDSDSDPDPDLDETLKP
ncbi:MAG TPA: hypothetical protein PLH01_02485, partial [Kiritimatiellia bacterium]|nr:hypothetical protein [Kiritimatiellia bacterium]